MQPYGYLDVDWHHDLPDEPIRLLSERNAGRYEVRKVDICRDGRTDWADAKHEIDSTRPSEKPIPDIDSINEGRQVSARSMSQSEFTAFWAMASARLDQS